MKNIKLLKIITFVLVISIYLVANENKRVIWLNDKEYLEGVMYLKGQKGFDTIQKTINNCPYDRCKSADIDKKDLNNITTLEIKKPNFKKAIELLFSSAQKGNVLAAELLVNFLKTRIDYKSTTPNKFLLDLLKEETGLSYQNYKKIITKSAILSADSKKGCEGPFFLAQTYEFGHMKTTVSQEKSQYYYKLAAETCPKNTLLQILSSNKIPGTLK